MCTAQGRIYVANENPKHADSQLKTSDFGPNYLG